MSVPSYHSAWQTQTDIPKHKNTEIDAQAVAVHAWMHMLKKHKLVKSLKARSQFIHINLNWLELDLMCDDNY